MVEEGPGTDGGEIDACCRGAVEVATHAALDIVGHLDFEGFESPFAGVVGC